MNASYTRLSTSSTMSDHASIDHKTPGAVIEDGDRKVPYTDHSSGDRHISSGYIEELDSKKERALVWKFDIRILPILAIMYLFNALDKSNLGTIGRRGASSSN